MDPVLQKALIAGLERISAWSDVLDRINVFPVADGDTGRNLKISLSPLRRPAALEKTVRDLLLSARGNSGNIATLFFSGFLNRDTREELDRAARMGRDLAWQAVHKPIPGTMLTVFDALVDFLSRKRFQCDPGCVTEMVEHLGKAVRSTPELLPALKHAGVVDAGALGMHLFFEGFFLNLVGLTDDCSHFSDIFHDMLAVSPSFKMEDEGEGYCVDMVLEFQDDVEEKVGRLAKCGGSLVVIPHHKYFKVHLHTSDAGETRKRAESLGRVVQWSHDDLGRQVTAFKSQIRRETVHVATDAAGAVTRDDALELGITLLDSYVTVGEKSLPETLFNPSEVYRLMREGVKASTSQASLFERHQCYHRIVHQYPRILYLCTGSVFTGNYQTAMAWKQAHDPDDRLTVIDTTAASGRLGLIAIASARFSAQTDDPEAVIAYALRAIGACQEYVFLDKLKYLAAGGRLSKSSAFLGDAFHVKPIISPTAEGAKKVGAAKNREGQLTFALKRLDEVFSRDAALLVMLEYSDNLEWVQNVAKKEIERLFPMAEVLLRPLSLTSGVHMGPGTWGLAFLPELRK